MAELHLERTFLTEHGRVNVEIRITEADYNGALTKPDAPVLTQILDWYEGFPQQHD